MKTIVNICLAAALFAAGFVVTRAFREIVAPDAAETGSESENPIAGSQNRRGKSLIGTRPYRSPREYFDLWQSAGSDPYRTAADVVIEEWARTSPETGIEFALEQNEPGLAWSLVRQWAEYDDRAALRIAKALPVGSTSDVYQRRKLLNLALKRRFQESPEELPELLSDFPLGLEPYIGSIDESDLGDIDPVRQAAALEKISERSLKTRYAGPLLSKWARTDPEAALQWMEEHLPDPDGWVFSELLRGWAANDPAAAAARLPEKGDIDARIQAVHNFLTETLAKDPEFARTWVSENHDEFLEKALNESAEFPDGDFRSLKAEFDSSAEGEDTAPAAVEPFWPPQTEDDVRHWAKRNFSTDSKSSPRTWKIEEIQAATAFLIENPELATTANWHRDLSERWANENPIAALEWSASLPPELQIEAAETAIETWFHLEPKRAVAYTESLPESEFRGYAIEKVIGEWLQSDPDASVQWAASLPAAAERDTAAGRIARHFRFRDPSRAVEIAGSIENRSLRLDSLISIVAVWSRRDQPAAEAFVRQGNFSETERKALLDRLSRP